MKPFILKSARRGAESRMEDKFDDFTVNLYRDEEVAQKLAESIEHGKESGNQKQR
jgi:hypothetical protein